MNTENTSLHYSKRKHFLLFLILIPMLVSYKFVVAQSTALEQPGFNFQAVLRDTDGQPIASKEVRVRIAILQNGPAGDALYTETQTVQTDAFGLIHLVVGRGEANEGSLSGITWLEQRHWLQVELDREQSGNFSLIGSSEILAVPQALHAGTADRLTDMDAIKGTQWLEGNGKPEASTGQPNNYYIDLASGKVWHKSGDNWLFRGFLSPTVNQPTGGSRAGDDWLLVGNAGTTPGTNFVGTTDSTHLIFKVNNTEAMRLNADGSFKLTDGSKTFTFKDKGGFAAVGVGTDNPLSQMHFRGSSNGVTLRLENVGSGGRTWAITSNATGSAFGPGGSLTFYDFTGSQTRMVVDNTGQVGINTTSPNKKLHVATGVAGDGARIGNTFVGNRGSDADWAEFRQADNASLDAYAVIQNQNGLTILNSASGQDMRFRIGNVDKMILDATGNVGVGTTSPDASAALDLTSTTQGFLVPRMSSAERLAIGTPAKGLLIFDNDSSVFKFYNGSMWKDLDTDTDTDDQTLSLSGNDLTISNGNTEDLSSITPITLADADNDTRVETEKNADEDQIRFATDDVERMIIASNGHVGVGTVLPDTTLHIVGSIKMEDGNQADGYLLVSDSNGIMTWTDPDSIQTSSFFELEADTLRPDSSVIDMPNVSFVFGSVTLGDNGDPEQDTKLFFQKNKGALRAGIVKDDRWDYSNLGAYSTAFGNQPQATGHSSAAFNNKTAATGNNATAFNYQTTASGTASNSFGYNSEASGQVSTAFGRGTTAPSYGEFVVGHWNQGYSIASADTINSSDRLFVVANGTDSANRSNAMVVLKSGAVGLGTNFPSEKLHVNGSIRMVDGNEAVGFLPVSDANGVLTWTDPDNIQTRSIWALEADTVKVDTNVVDIENADFVFGSPHLWDDDIDAHEARFFFDKSLSAFRAGKTDNDHWDEAKRGDLSVAFGKNTEATGKLSFVIGRRNIATGLLSFAAGEDAIASGERSISWGDRTIAAGEGSIAGGLQAEANGKYSLAFGDSAITNIFAQSSVAIGDHVTAESTGSIAIGIGSLASGEYSLAAGQNCETQGEYSLAVGDSAVAMNDASVAVGDFVRAEGQGSIALGKENTAFSYLEMVLGLYATEYTPNNAGSFDADDRLVTIGNGTAAGSRSDAMVILKKGHTGFGTSVPDTTLHVVGSIKMEDGNEQIGFVPVSDGNGIMTWTDPSAIRVDTAAVLADADNDTKIQVEETADEDKIRFDTNGSERLVIDNTGYVGIGTASPDALLHLTSSVYGDTTGLKISQGGSNSLIYHSSDNDLIIRKLNRPNQLVLDEGGNVGINETIPVSQLHVTDNFTNASSFVVTIENTANGANANGLLIEAGQSTFSSASNMIRFNSPGGGTLGTIAQNSSTSVAYNTTSDRRLKTNFRPTQYGLSTLIAIEVRDYQYKNDLSKDHTGFIAQQLYALYPEAVTKGGEDPRVDPWMVDYSKVTPLLVQSIQDLKQIVDAQQQEIERLSALVEGSQKSEAKKKEAAASAALK